MENNYITLAYKLYIKDIEEDDETLYQQCGEDHPFQFISNFGLTLPAFEKEVGNLEAGKTFDFVIPCADAYGDYRDDLVYPASRSIFEVDGKFDTDRIYVGATVPLRMEDDSVVPATVIDINDEKVTLDFNQPLAGHDLHFVGKIVQNRPATTEEMVQMANALSGEGGCGGHCGGCGGGSCGGGCGDGGCGSGCGGCH